jgi:hypothetical protein
MPEEGAHKILIPEPEAGSALYFTIQPAQVYLLGFAPERSTIEQDGQDVRVLCENGGRIVLHDFFSAISQEDITLELRDGTLISGKDLAEVLAMSLKDFQTQGDSDFTAAVVDAAGLVVEEKGVSTRCLRLEDVLDTSPPSLFATLPVEIVRGEHNSGAVIAIKFVAPPGESITPDEASASLLLSLQRMDM